MEQKKTRFPVKLLLLVLILALLIVGVSGYLVYRQFFMPDRGDTNPPLIDASTDGPGITEYDGEVEFEEG